MSAAAVAPGTGKTEDGFAVAVALERRKRLRGATFFLVAWVLCFTPVLLAFLDSSHWTSERGGQSIAEIVEAKGSVLVRLDGGILWSQVVPGAALPNRTTISTEESSGAVLELAESGERIRLGPHTHLLLSSADGEGSDRPELELLTGKIEVLGAAPSARPRRNLSFLGGLRAKPLQARPLRIQASGKVLESAAASRVVIDTSYSAAAPRAQVLSGSVAAVDANAVPGAAPAVVFTPDPIANAAAAREAAAAAEAAQKPLLNETPAAPAWELVVEDNNPQAQKAEQAESKVAKNTPTPVAQKRVVPTPVPLPMPPLPKLTALGSEAWLWSLAPGTELPPLQLALGKEGAQPASANAVARLAPDASFEAARSSLLPLTEMLRIPREAFAKSFTASQELGAGSLVLNALLRSEYVPAGKALNASVQPLKSAPPFPLRLISVAKLPRKALAVRLEGTGGRASLDGGWFATRGSPTRKRSFAAQYVISSPQELVRLQDLLRSADKVDLAFEAELPQRALFGMRRNRLAVVFSPGGDAAQNEAVCLRLECDFIFSGNRSAYLSPLLGQAEFMRVLLSRPHVYVREDRSWKKVGTDIFRKFAGASSLLKDEGRSLFLEPVELVWEKGR